MDDLETEEDETGRITALETQISGISGEGGQVGQNTSDIEELDGRVTENETDLDENCELTYGTPRDVGPQHDGLAACDATGLVNVATCADARIRHNEEAICDLLTTADDGTESGRVVDIEGKLMDKKAYIEAIQGELMIDNEGNGTREDGMSRLGYLEHMVDHVDEVALRADEVSKANAEEIGMDENGMSRIDHNEQRSMTNAKNIESNDMDIAENAAEIVTERTARMQADMGHDEALAEGARLIGANATSIGENAAAIGRNMGMINDNRNMIGELSDDPDVVRAGVAASMALAGMPAVNGRGIAIGVGSFDGESAFAVGFQIQGEQASFKVGVTSSGGATGASAGVGFNF